MIMKGKVIFITGGNAGIGLSVAEEFAKQGAGVAVFSRREKKNLEAVERINSLGGSGAYFTGDITDEASVSAAIKGTAERFGGLHFAFNNAGFEQTPSPLPEQTSEEFHKIVNVNFYGVWLCMKEQAPLIQASGGGCIVNCGSISSVVGVQNSPIYTGTKHAVAGMTKAVALEYAKQGVRVNTVSPAMVKTDLYENYLKGAEDRDALNAALEAAHPMGRAGEPEEIAAAVLYLCRDATWTTGQNLILDGGYTAQ